MPIVTINDINVNYEFHGPSEGIPLVLIEGWGQSLWCWFKQLPDFSQKYRVLVFDNRGAGKTSKPDYPYTVEMLANDTKTLMDELGIAKAHIFGISMGGFIAQKFAISYPEKILSLTIGMTNFGGNLAVPASGKVMSAIFAYPTETISKEESIVIRRSVAWSPDFLRQNKDLIRNMDKWIEEN
ncbi:MAG: alpha/beta fold hydrolase, partial [Candidatus Hodarchaeales archaeon]